MKSSKLKQEYEKYSGKIVMFRPDLIREKTENIAEEFVAAGKRGDDLG